MSSRTNEDIYIAGTGLFTPAESISNEELVTAFNAYVENHNSANAKAIDDGEMVALEPSSAEFIEKASGIKSRFVMDRSGIVNPDRMCPSLSDRSNDSDSIQCEMAIAAGREALEQAGMTGADIGAVIVACSNLQRAYPAVAVEVQAALGIDGFAFDMNVACSSATFGIQTAVDAIRNESASSVLMVNPEICSGHLNFRDRDSHFIFGDACTAVVLSNEKTGYKVIGTRLKTLYSNNIRNNFGFLNRGDEDGIGKVDKLFVQNGRKVFKEVCPMVAEQISQHVHDEGFEAQDLKRMWLHQANLSMNQLISRRVLGRAATEAEAPVILDRYANTSSAGSIIAFHLHKDDLATGDLGVICSFGAGYSVGSVLVEKQ
ncbi:MAG: beta-ketoacyl-ACP synthase III [Pseudomonadales bacterium]